MRLKRRKIWIHFLSCSIMTVLLTIIIPIPFCAGKTAVSTEQPPTTKSDTSGFSITPTLTIKKGLREQKYEDFLEVESYTIERLENLGCFEQDYTVLDQKKGVFIVHAYGVDILDLLKDCNLLSKDIPPKSLYKNPDLLSNEIDFDSLLFRTKNGQTTEISVEELLSVKRWEFDDLPERYNIETGEIEEGVSNQSLIQTLIVWKDLWLQMPKYTMENEMLKWAWEHPFYEQSEISENTFQLLPGQKDIGDYNGDIAISGITEIDFIMKASVSGGEVLEPISPETTDDTINQKETSQPVKNEMTETDNYLSQEQPDLLDINNESAIQNEPSEREISISQKLEKNIESEIILKPEVSPVQPEPIIESEHASIIPLLIDYTVKEIASREKSPNPKPSFNKETHQASNLENPLTDLQRQYKSENNQPLTNQSPHSQFPFIGETPVNDNIENSISDSQSKQSNLLQTGKEKESLAWLKMMAEQMTEDLPSSSGTASETVSSVKQHTDKFGEHNHHSKIAIILTKFVYFLMFLEIFAAGCMNLVFPEMEDRLWNFFKKKHIGLFESIWKKYSIIY